MESYSSNKNGRTVLPIRFTWIFDRDEGSFGFSSLSRYTLNWTSSVAWSDAGESGSAGSVFLTTSLSDWISSIETSGSSVNDKLSSDSDSSLSMQIFRFGSFSFTVAILLGTTRLTHRRVEGVWNPLPEPEPVLKTHYQIFLRWPNVTYNNFILDFLVYIYDALHKQCLV